MVLWSRTSEVVITLNIRRSIPFVRDMTAFVENQIVVALRFGLDSLANTIPAIQAWRKKERISIKYEQSDSNAQIEFYSNFHSLCKEDILSAVRLINRIKMVKNHEEENLVSVIFVFLASWQEYAFDVALQDKDVWHCGFINILSHFQLFHFNTLNKPGFNNDKLISIHFWIKEI